MPNEMPSKLRHLSTGRATRPNAISVSVERRAPDAFEVRVAGRRYSTLKNESAALRLARQLRADQALPAIHAQLCRVRP